MKRLMHLAVLACAILGLASAVAVAEPSPHAGLGQPTSVSPGAYTAVLDVMSTTQCPGFAPNDTLTFSGAEFHYVFWIWPEIPRHYYPPHRWVGELSGSTNAGSWTYSVRGHYDSGVTTGEDFAAGVRATITRSDGRKMSGEGSVFYLPGSGVTRGLVFYGAPTCK